MLIELLKDDLLDLFIVLMTWDGASRVSMAELFDMNSRHSSLQVCLILVGFFLLGRRCGKLVKLGIKWMIK